MATKNISITEGAYRRLASLRRGDESFSKIINRITQARDIMQFAGILSKSSADAMEGHIERQRIRHNKNLKDRIARLGEEMN
ncbi:MAG: antitoxin VapB family protein [Gemmatimonadetes bacterium]|nr:antitoxin VapB family protein [Gemmatimonadota bacterium]